MAETDYPRRFVKTGEVLDDLTRIEPYFRDLLARDITALADLE